MKKDLDGILLLYHYNSAAVKQKRMECRKSAASENSFSVQPYTYC